MEIVGAQGSELKATALNDYAANLPFTDAADHGVMLAMKVDGQIISVREKGPLWVIYPFDSDPNLAVEQFYARSVWQLKSISVLP